MQLSTKYFGTIDCDAEDILHFKNGLFGFDEETEFMLLPFEGSDGTLLSLQSVHTPALAFTAMNPFPLQPDYTPVLLPGELTALGVEDSHDLAYFVLCVVKQPVADSTVNLKCPVVINEDSRQ
ncbi:MAG: flagellar assembly protein FliW, partial [Oscillospiraceae bacterium]